MPHQQISSTPISFHFGVSTQSPNKWFLSMTSSFLQSRQFSPSKIYRYDKSDPQGSHDPRKSQLLDSFFTGLIRDILVQAHPPISCRNTRSE
ncbi:hypothetical protein TNIN_97001 [Trichonephila inaurata madagascariensis]|uniref:Uncharacterized protein n=1 Tax=Trichonephila inaurata madagascariensis TaxID=2747483 RepID=A0A8X6XCA3_9ARAC|nr:hypothetical protein TNIN_97001 [Trichonephila inaurata madagascariensis]